MVDGVEQRYPRTSKIGLRRVFPSRAAHEGRCHQSTARHIHQSLKMGTYIFYLLICCLIVLIHSDFVSTCVAIEYGFEELNPLFFGLRELFAAKVVACVILPILFGLWHRAGYHLFACVSLFVLCLVFAVACLNNIMILIGGVV